MKQRGNRIVPDGDWSGVTDSHLIMYTQMYIMNGCGVPLETWVAESETQFLDPILLSFSINMNGIQDNMKTICEKRQSLVRLLLSLKHIISTIRTIVWFREGLYKRLHRNVEQFIVYFVFVSTSYCAVRP